MALKSSFCRWLHRSALSLAFVLIATARFMRAAPPPRESALPFAPPYADKRALFDTAFERLDWKDAKRDREVPAKIYFPTDANGELPIIIFSHGLGGSREGYEYLGRQWAANGYVVIHLQHLGSDSSVLRGIGAGAKPIDVLRKAANLENAVARALDVRFAVDRLAELQESDAALKGKLDLKKIGLAGHSFGANTAMLVAGQEVGVPGREKLSDDRVSCVIAMSEPAPMARGKLDELYSPVHIPVFMMTGTEDTSPLGETKAEDRRLPYDHLTHDASLLILTGGDHMVFSGRLVRRPSDEQFQRIIREASTAFWDAHLRNDEAAGKWLSAGDFKTSLGEQGTYESK